jgi:hypothetical protein
MVSLASGFQSRRKEIDCGEGMEIEAQPTLINASSLLSCLLN